jgi:hypothetical protein
MSKFKNIPGLVWLVIGVLVTLLVIPTTAYAAGALKYVGIEGTSTNKADVSPAGQLLTTEAGADSLFDSGARNINNGSNGAPMYAPPQHSAGILMSIHLDVYGDAGAGNAGESFYIGPSCNTEDFLVDSVNPTTVGTVILPCSPGVVIPAGDELCAISTGSIASLASANGYTVPAADAPTVPGG